MWVIEKPGKYICGVYNEEPIARSRRKTLGVGYRLKKVAAQKFPFFIVEVFQGRERIFRFWQKLPDLPSGVTCTIFEISGPWEPPQPGTDAMGELPHNHYGEDSND